MVKDATEVAHGRGSQDDSNGAQDEVERARREDPTARIDNKAGKTTDLLKTGLLPNFAVEQDVGTSEGKDKTELGENDKGGKSLHDIQKDDKGRIVSESRSDGSTAKIEYSGEEKEPSKVTITNKDGSVITLEKGKDGVDSLNVDEKGNFSAQRGAVNTRYILNGDRLETVERGGFQFFGFKINQDKATTTYHFNSNGELTRLEREDFAGNSETLRKDAKSGTWSRRSDANPEQREFIGDVKANPDGGYTYTKANVQVEQEAYGARHITEKTETGSYSQSFDPDGKLTQVVRKNDEIGKTELVTISKDGKGSLLVYDTNNPDSYQSYDDVKVQPDGSFSYTDKDGKELNRTREFGDTALNQIPLDPEATKVATQNGVEVRRRIEDGHFVYDYTVKLDNHDEQTILSTDKPPNEAGEELHRLADHKMTELEHKYGIKISRDGDTTEANGKDVPTRSPNIGQLTGLQSALERSVNDIKTFDGEPLEVSFLAEQSQEGRGGFASGHRVVIEPNGGIKDPSSVESVFLHELAHNGQRELFNNNAPMENQYAGKMGFVRSENGKDWLLTTKDGKYLKSVEDEDGVGSDHWVLVDSKGRPVDESGEETYKPIELSNEEARDRALVRPISTYFPNPREMGAEAAQAYRQSEQSRRMLHAQSPELYQAYKELDQLDLNREYGLNKDGEPNYIRNKDGIPVPNTEANRKAVEEYEASFDETERLGKDVSGGLSVGGAAAAGIGRLIQHLKEDTKGK